MFFVSVPTSSAALLAVVAITVSVGTIGFFSLDFAAKCMILASFKIADMLSAVPLLTMLTSAVSGNFEAVVIPVATDVFLVATTRLITAVASAVIVPTADNSVSIRISSITATKTSNPSDTPLTALPTTLAASSPTPTAALTPLSSAAAHLAVLTDLLGVPVVPLSPLPPPQGFSFKHRCNFLCLMPATLLNGPSALLLLQGFSCLIPLAVRLLLG
mmetsp:Transcript_24149/g.60304  ORF Transcript_24149/g.60304 Transcript_24149/m.60304 type:complete len:216 (-) Transcript_24149:1313-1960(-)